ncbi:MAG: tyrosine-protein phosphatase [Candidatus Krumholzibacteriales bacterium]
MAQAGQSSAEKPARRARPVKLDGVPNLYRVSPSLYRSAQPSGEGMRNLRDIGIETIVNLRSFHSDRDEIGSTSLGYVHIYMKPWHPERKEAVRFLRVATDPESAPVLVHCMDGADRTGAMCALYRIAVQGWTKREAIREMTEGGFGYHRIWANLTGWVEDMDIKSLKEDAGIDKMDENSCRADSLSEN